MLGRSMNTLSEKLKETIPGETGGMLGNHSISLLADAWAKGIRTFDPEKALKAYAHEAMPIDVASEVLFTFISLIILFEVNTLLFHFNQSAVKITWQKMLLSLVAAW